MGGYHETYAIKQKGRDGIVCIEGRFHIYSSMQAAALKLAGLAMVYPKTEFTIVPLRVSLPWAEDRG